MKRLLQFVAVVLIAGSAVPPAVAAGLCTMLQGTQSVGMTDCCADMQWTMRDIPAATLQAPSCSNSCCTVSSPGPQARTSASELLTGLSSFDAVDSVAAPPQFCTDDVQRFAPPHSSLARYVLLKTFRI